MVKALSVKRTEATGNSQNPANLQAELEAMFRKMWIPVSERLPEDAEEVLVCNVVLNLFYLASRQDGRWIPDYSRDPVSGITHWMQIIPPEVQP